RTPIRRARPAKAVRSSRLERRAQDHTRRGAPRGAARAPRGNRQVADPASSTPAQFVLRAKPPGHERPEPRGPVVEGHGGKGYVVERRSSVSLAENFQRQLVTEIGHERDAGAIATKGVPDAVPLSDARQVAPRHRDIAGPDMADARVRQRREDS